MRWDKRKDLRLFYDIEVDGRKGYKFKRFAQYQSPFVGTGDRNKDRREYNYWLETTHGYTLKDFPDCELHHDVSGYLMLVPYEIHRIPHIGFVGVVKALLFS